MAKIVGAQRVAARLRKGVSQQGMDLVQSVLFEAGQRVQTDAQQSITDGAVSGAGHVPSRPGKPPNNDTGGLANNIETLETGPLKVTVSSNAKYAAIHEFGGTINHPGGTPYFMRDGMAVFVSNSGHGAFHNLPVTKPHDIVMPARPYMGPALQKNKARIAKRVAAAVNQANRMK